jgi:hypothetical protein
MPLEFKIVASAILLLLAAGLIFPKGPSKEKAAPFIDANAWQHVGRQ